MVESKGLGQEVTDDLGFSAQPAHFDMSTEVYRIRQRLEYLERLRAQDQVKFEEMAVWQQRYSQSHGEMIKTLEHLIVQNAGFPKAINSLKVAITALTKTVETQVEESSKWHVELSKLYMEMVSSIASTNKDVSNTAKVFKKHEKKDSVITKSVVVLYSLLTGVLTMLVIGFWDATLWPRLKASIVFLLGGSA